MSAMSIEDYVRGIRFKIGLAEPGLSLPIEVKNGLAWRDSARQLYMLDLLVVDLPQENREMRARLHPLQRVPAMSCFTIAALINTIVAGLDDDAAYLNVGVWHGYSLLAGMLGNPGKRVIGVDNFSGFGGPREAFGTVFEKYRSPAHAFHEMDSAAYLARHHQGPVGFYFYDGDHSYEAQLGGLESCEPFLTRDALILVDDTNREAPRQATLDFLNARPGRYEIIWDVKTGFDTHPAAWNGLMLLRRKG